MRGKGARNFARMTGQLRTCSGPYTAGKTAEAKSFDSTPPLMSDSEFHRNKARSATWKCVEPTHFASVWTSFGRTGLTWVGPAGTVQR